MAFGQELKDFVAAFQVGYDMVESKDEKEERRLQNRLRKIQAETAETELAEFNDPENRALRKRGALADVGYKEASTRALDIDTDPETVRLRREDTQSQIDARRAANSPEAIEADRRSSAAAASVNEENARAQRLENDKAEERAARMRRRVAERLGIPVEDLPEADYENKGPEQAIPAAEGKVSTGPTPEVGDEDRDLAIRTIIGEANNQGEEGQQAVANVILNRLSSGRYGNSMSDIVLAKRQFEPWDTRKAELLSYQPGTPEWERAARALDAAMQEDITGGATHFLNPDVVRKRRGGTLPPWARGETTATIGAHAFYAPEGKVADGSVGADRYSPALAAIEEMDAGTEAPPRGSREDLVSSGREAVKQGLLYLVELAGLNKESGVPDPNIERAQAGYLLGEGAADATDVAAAQEIVKTQIQKIPNRKDDEVSEAELNLATLAVTYEMYLEEGDLQSAQNVAGSILQYYRRSASQYIAIAQAAADSGKMTDAVEAAVKAYAFVPDGREVSVDGDQEKGYTVTIKDLASGETINKQLVPPQEMYAKIMGFGPGDFDRQILLAAGQDLPETTSAAFQEAVPEAAGMSLEEAKEARLSRAGQTATPRGNAAKAFDDPERIGAYGDPTGIGIAPTFGTGIRGAVEQYLFTGQVDPETGEVIPDTEPAKQMTEGELQEVAMRYEQLADQIINVNGFNADPRLVVNFLLNATANLEDETGGVQWLEDENGARYAAVFDGVEIPIDDATGTIIAAMRGEAERERQEDEAAAKAKADRQALELEDRQREANEQFKREEDWRNRTGRNRDFRYTPAPMQAIP